MPEMTKTEGSDEMARTASAPLGALFFIMKRYGKISYNDLATCILSEKPLAGGVSPASRVNDRTWISRYLVHAPVESVKEDYFVSHEKAAMRIISRLKKRMGNQEILDMIAGQPGVVIVGALANCGQDTAPYRNMLSRLAGEDAFKIEERVEIAMVLLVTAALSGNVARATARALEFTDEIHGASVRTPLVTPQSEGAPGDTPADIDERVNLGLLRIVDGYVMGSPFWLDATNPDGIEVGAFATGAGAISDVAPDVSGHHARIWHDESDIWYVEGLGSKNGTVLVSGVDKSEAVVEPPADERTGWTGAPVALQPGDELVFGKSTRYVVIAGVK